LLYPFRFLCIFLSAKCAKALTPRVCTQISFLHQHARWHSQADRIVDDIHLSLIVHGAKRWQRQKGLDRLRDRIDDLKRTIDWYMDDVQFQQLLRDSQVCGFFLL